MPTTATPQIKPGSALLTNDRECLLDITDSLRATGQVLALLNSGLSNPNSTIAELASILKRDVMLSARIVRVANSTFYANRHSTCKTIDDALQRVGIREIARLVSTAMIQGMAPAQLIAYGITGAQFNKNVLFTASASQMLASEIKIDPNLAYLAGLMRPLGVLVLNQWGEQNYLHVENIDWGDAISLLDWETQTFGINHLEVSGFITRKWAFPSIISDSIERSTEELGSIEDCPLALILQTAEVLAERNQAALHSKQHTVIGRDSRLNALGIDPIQLTKISQSALIHTGEF